MLLRIFITLLISTSSLLAFDDTIFILWSKKIPNGSSEPNINTWDVNITTATNLTPYIITPTGATNFWVSWGDGDISNKNGSTALSHTYTTSGSYTISMSGKVTKLTFPANAYLKNIASAMPRAFATNLTTISDMFTGCSGLTNVDTVAINTIDLFNYATNATLADQLFQNCSTLLSLPTNQFSKNTKITDFQYICDGCSSLRSIPVGYFTNNKSVTTYQYSFLDCTNLTTLPTSLFSPTGEVSFYGTFNNAGLTNIPTGLFDNSPLATTFQITFRSCDWLKTIPAGLFNNNTAVTTFREVFRDCPRLENPPSGLFDYNTNVNNMSYAFLNDTNIINLPNGFFAHQTNTTTFFQTFKGLVWLTNLPADLVPDSTNLTSVGEMFNGNRRMSGYAIPFWDTGRFPNITVSNDCYLGCTNLIDYGDIPIGFR